VFAYVGSTIARGGMPYSDAWDLKPPGIYLAYALLGWIAADHGWLLMAWLRAADLLIAAGCGVLLVLLARRCCGPAAGWAAAGWYASLYLHGTFWSLAQAEAWANPLVLGAILLALREPGPRGPARPWFCAGLLLGAAALLKFTALAPAVPFLAWALWKAPEERADRAFALLGGTAAPMILAWLWLFARGAWGDYLEIQRGFVEPYALLNAPTLGKRVQNLFGHTLGWFAQLWLPSILGLCGLLAGVFFKDRGVRPFAVLLLAGLTAVWVQNKYFGYHWQTAIPGFALLGAAGTVAVLRRAGMREVPAAALAAALPLVWSLGTQWPFYRDAALLAAGRLPRERWLAHFRPPGKDFSFPADARVADYVRKHTAPADPVLIWGFEPAVYLLAGRRAPTRFFFAVPVAVTFTPKTWREEFLEDLRARPPALFLVVRNDIYPWATGRRDDSAGQLRAWPDLREWLADHYRRETQIEDFTVYRRLEPERTARNGARWTVDSGRSN
jgi:hypothetical protein